MSILKDPRVKRNVVVSDEAYLVYTQLGVWDVVQATPGVWVAAPPNGQPSGYRGEQRNVEEYLHWEKALPRFDSAEQAIESFLDR
jgi:hypothetical protein